MKKRRELCLVFVFVLSIIFLSPVVYAQTASILLKFDFPEPKIVKDVFTYDNISYDSIRMESVDRYGGPGKPIKPFKTVRILLPQDGDLKNINIIAGNKVTLDGRYRIEYGKTPIPIGWNVTGLTKPIKEIYSSTNPFPDRLYSQLPL